MHEQAVRQLLLMKLAVHSPMVLLKILTLSGSSDLALGYAHFLSRDQFASAGLALKTIRGHIALRTIDGAGQVP